MEIPDNAPTIETTTGTSEKLFIRGDSFFSALINDIDNAQQSIELESYIFNKDALGNRVINSLINAAKRGVAVRVLIDGIGSADDGKEIARTLEAQGVHVRIYHPLPWQVDRYHWSVHQGSLFGRLLYFIQKINKRNHRKLCIIDNHSVWTGSLNISAQHLGLKNGGEGWHDFGVCVTGSTAPPIKATFDALWHRKRVKPRIRSFTRFISNVSPRMRLRKNNYLLNKIRNATERIWICSAYFAPSPSVLRALRYAVGKRAVEAALIVPSTSDVPFFPLLTSTYYADLLKMGVAIHEYTPAFLHAKAMIIDDLCIIGSSNLNHRSFLHDLELDIILTQPESVQQLQEQFIIDMNQSNQITRQNLRWGVWHTSVAWIPRLLRYWL